jgi:hypothetical protein
MGADGGLAADRTSACVIAIGRPVCSSPRAVIAAGVPLPPVIFRLAAAGVGCCCRGGAAAGGGGELRRARFTCGARIIGACRSTSRRS